MKCLAKHPQTVSCWLEHGYQDQNHSLDIAIFCQWTGRPRPTGLISGNCLYGELFNMATSLLQPHYHVNYSETCLLRTPGGYNTRWSRAQSLVIQQKYTSVIEINCLVTKCPLACYNVVINLFSHGSYCHRHFQSPGLWQYPTRRWFLAIQAATVWPTLSIGCLMQPPLYYIHFVGPQVAAFGRYHCALAIAAEIHSSVCLDRFRCALAMTVETH